MPKALSRSAAKRGHKTKLIVRLLVPMLALLLFQILASFAVLILGGEFSYVRQYAFGTLIEKTENRKSYIESDFQQKMPTVLETSEKITAIVEEILDERIGSISDITKDNALNRDIMEAVLDNIVDMLRRSNSNDAYIILETGELYKDANTGKTGKAALYLRDLDAASDAGFEDLLLEVGFSSISRDFGITMDSGWKLHFEPDPNDLQSYGFYYNTLKTAKEHPGKLENLGYWSSFSRPSRAAAESIKYTVPLIWSDGTVYGVVGIGLTENTLLSNLPANDFLSETACYVLGKGSDDNRFDIIMHSGTAFGKLVQNAQSLALAVSAEDGVYGFSDPPNAGLSGSVQYMTLYNQTSPYYGEKWALISIADTDSVLSPLNSLIRMLVIASAVSLGISVVVVILICRAVTKPISSAIKTMNSNSDYNKVIRFSPSNIYELDSMTDAITQLQINVQDFSSQVSQMIRIADVGLGTFMYDRSDGSVFVGQSLLKLLNFDMDREEDVLMSGDVFLDSIAEPETRAVIDEGMALALKDASSDYEKEYSIEPEDGSTVWMRLSLVHNKDKSIGILQDITGEMMEKQRIEYERDYDGTTGLLNRKAFYRRLEELFRERDKLGVTAMLMMDLDNLKYVNDTYGHDFGDDYIKTAATTLKLFRDYGGVISRLSGDEFCVCLPGFDSKEEILKIVGDIRQQLLSSYCLLADGTHFKIRASAGLSWYPDDAVSQEMLMKYADFAMYTVKHSTKGELAQFDKNAYDKDSVLLTGVEEMERIIDECSIKYAFHSIVNAHTGEIYGYEALMRPQSTVLQSFRSASSLTISSPAEPPSNAMVMPAMDAVSGYLEAFSALTMVTCLFLR